MPPAQHPVWEHFLSQPVPGKQHKLATCKYCEDPKPVAGQPIRMMKHLVFQCARASQSVKETFRSLVPSQPAHEKRKQPSSPTSARKKNRTSRSTPTSSPRRIISPKEMQEFQYDMASLIFAMGLSFRQIENPKLKWFVDKYHRGYKPPNRHSVGGRFLDKAYEDEKREVIQAIEGQQYVTIVTDGYSDINNVHIMNYMVVAPNLRPMFWGSVRTDAERQTGDYISTELLKIIKEVEDECRGVRVVGLTTDNAENMKNAWKKVALVRKDIVAVGCSAHALNLVLEKVFEIPECKQARESAVSLSKFIRNRSVLLARFRQEQARQFPRQKGRLALTLPVPTRWYSSQRCIRGVLQNRNVIKAVFNDVVFMNNFKGKKLVAAQRLIAKEDFWAGAQRTLEITSPISKSMAYLEHDNCSLSKVYEEFNRLLALPLYRGDREDESLPSMVSKIISERWTKHRTREMDVAFLVDPTVDFAGFQDDDAHKAFENTLKLAKTQGYDVPQLGELQKELSRFIMEKKQWQADVLERNKVMGPSTWWHCQTRYPVLERFALRILALPSSSAASERSWSIHNFIQSKRRNRLGPEKLEKLAFVYSNMGSKDPVEPAWKRKRRQEMHEAIAVSFEAEYTATTSRVARSLFGTSRDEDSDGNDGDGDGVGADEEELELTTADFIFEDHNEGDSHTCSLLCETEDSDDEDDDEIDYSYDYSPGEHRYSPRRPSQEASSTAHQVSTPALHVSTLAQHVSTLALQISDSVPSHQAPFPLQQASTPAHHARVPSWQVSPARQASTLVQHGSTTARPPSTPSSHAVPTLAHQASTPSWQASPARQASTLVQHGSTTARPPSTPSSHAVPTLAHQASTPSWQVSPARQASTLVQHGSTTARPPSTPSSHAVPTLAHQASTPSWQASPARQASTLVQHGSTTARPPSTPSSHAVPTLAHQASTPSWQASPARQASTLVQHGSTTARPPSTPSSHAVPTLARQASPPVRYPSIPAHHTSTSSYIAASIPLHQDQGSDHQSIPTRTSTSDESPARDDGGTFVLHRAVNESPARFQHQNNHGSTR